MLRYEYIDGVEDLGGDKRICNNIGDVGESSRVEMLVGV